MRPRRHGSPFLGLRIPDPGRGNTATCAHRVSSMDGAAWLQFILSVILKGGHLAADTAVRETWVRSLGWGDPLEREMATDSSALAWRIPWMEEPGGLQSTGSQRVGHD